MSVVIIKWGGFFLIQTQIILHLGSLKSRAGEMFTWECKPRKQKEGSEKKT